MRVRREVCYGSGRLNCNNGEGDSLEEGSGVVKVPVAATVAMRSGKDKCLMLHDWENSSGDEPAAGGKWLPMIYEALSPVGKFPRIFQVNRIGLALRSKNSVESIIPTSDTHFLAALNEMQTSRISCQGFKSKAKWPTNTETSVHINTLNSIELLCSARIICKLMATSIVK